MKKNAILLLLVFALVVFYSVKITEANELPPSGGTTCSVDCGGSSIELTCAYECRASTKLKTVKCFDADGNVTDEKTCTIS